MNRVLSLVIAAGLALVLWSCGSEMQDPVSSTGMSSGGGVPILHKNTSPPGNVLAVVSGRSVTITWDSVAFADSYHVYITFNGNPYLDSMRVPRQFVLSNLSYGTYTVSVAGKIGSDAEGTASVPITFILSFGPPANLQATLSGLTATITWNAVATASSYHVIITRNGNPYLDLNVGTLQLIVPNLVSGTYSVTVAAIAGDLSEGSASVPITFILNFGPPANLQATLSGLTATITWNAVATASSYHVIITRNGNPYLDLNVGTLQLIVPNLVSGTYSVTVAAIAGDLSEGSASQPVVFTVSSVVAPTVTAFATPIPICVRNGAWITVTFSGVVTNSQGGASYELKDEYRKIHYKGNVSAGPYTVKLKLKDRRRGYDKDGRQYTFTIIATNSAGSAKATVVVTVPRDQRFRDRDDDDYDWDDDGR